ncbi:MAG: hypothetical protein HZC18_02690 [Candidatus Omnitrophica bacterium]|nr:hypothetical protein [Candidatus Omnitrophota bacterium]
MGVVYKFRKEVIDFVLQQKRTDDDLGCRQLAVLTSEKFKIQVSKSSVNAIIKNANLSNSVGRPLSAEPAPKKFQIPSQKKQQLLEEVRKVKLEQKPLPPKLLHQPPKDPEISRPKKDLAAEPRERGFSSSRRPKVPCGEEPIGRREPNGQATFLRHVESLRARRAQNKGIAREGMGCIFLKAAQWQLSRTSVLGGLLRKHISEPLPPSFDAFCDVLPCLNLLGVSEPSQIGRLVNHALWPLNGFEQPSSDLEIPRSNSIIGTISPKKSVRFFLEYEKEKRQVFMEASRFEFHLGNGSRIITDACLTGLGEDAGFSACAEQAMTMLSHCVISNNRPAIFLSSGGEVLDMMAAFEGAEGNQFKKVIVFDGAGERIAEFFSFPRKKRFFMLGVWPWQEEFSLLLSKNTRMAEPFYDEVTDKILYVAAGPAPIFQKELRGKGASLRSITVLTSPEGAPVMVILTNCADKAPTDILEAFLKRWPNLDMGPAGRALYAADISGEAGGGYVHFPLGHPASPPPEEEAQDLLGQAELGASVIFQDWGNALNRYCQKHFFGKEFYSSDITQLVSMFYSLSGYYVPQDRALLVLLCPSAAYSCFNELQRAVQLVNEGGILDPRGQPLVIKIIK